LYAGSRDSGPRISDSGFFAKALSNQCSSTTGGTPEDKTANVALALRPP
jgi:hypothetical protein